MFYIALFFGCLLFSTGKACQANCKNHGSVTFTHLVWWGKSNCHTPETSEWTILIRTGCHYVQQNCSDDVDSYGNAYMAAHLRMPWGAMPTRLLMMSSRPSNPLALMAMVNNARSPAINSRRRTSVEPNFPPEFRENHYKKSGRSWSNQRRGGEGE